MPFSFVCSFAQLPFRLLTELRQNTFCQHGSLAKCAAWQFSNSAVGYLERLDFKM